jgi:hypothetical protein
VIKLGDKPRMSRAAGWEKISTSGGGGKELRNKQGMTRVVYKELRKIFSHSILAISLQGKRCGV